LRRLLVIASLAIAVAASPAAAAAAVPASWAALGDQLAEPWPGLQNPEGTYQDYVYGGGVAFCLTRNCAPGLGNARYGEAVLGYALIQAGLRSGDEQVLRTGLRSINYIVRRLDLQDRLPTSFEAMSIGGAYNLARRRLADHPLFRRGRRHWERWLGRYRPVVLGSDRRHDNHTLVESVGILELARTGVRARRSGAVLARGNLRRYVRMARRALNETAPRWAARVTRRERGGVAATLSDWPAYPLAYHGFGFGIYARGVRLMGRHASGRARRLVRGAAHASWLLTAPDGDSGYTGRSMEEVWALTGTVHGLAVAATLPGTGAALDARYRAIADRVLERLRDAHGVGPQGVWLIPALREDPQAGMAAVDYYAGAAAFGGLAHMMLEWALAEGAPEGEDGQLAFDRDGSALLLRGDVTLGLVRSDEVWFAVKQATSYNRHVGDLRYDFGLVAAKARGGGGWEDVIPLRPKTSGPPVSAGPLLLETPEGTGIPYGRRMSLGGERTVRVRGGFRERSGRILRGGTRFRFERADCGVRMSLLVAAGDALEYSAFMRGRAADVGVRERSVSDGRHEVTASEPVRVSLEDGYASASDPRVVRARMPIARGERRVVSFTFCPR
jgi:hypothetical protein